MSADQLAAFVEQDHAALRAFMAGDPEPKKAGYSRQDDATLANPLGPPAKGWEVVSRRVEEAASMLQGAADLRFEQVTLVETPDLAYQVEIERYDDQQIAGMDEPRQVDLRVTTVGWRTALGVSFIGTPTRSRLRVASTGLSRDFQRDAE